MRAPAPILINQFIYTQENPMSNNNNEPRTDTIAETENFIAWKAEEPDGEVTYHVELNNVTVHFFEEEWTEFLELTRSLK
jgi:hypothetical protein